MYLYTILYIVIHQSGSFLTIIIFINNETIQISIFEILKFTKRASMHRESLCIHFTRNLFVLPNKYFNLTNFLNVVTQVLEYVLAKPFPPTFTAYT